MYRGKTNPVWYNHFHFHPLFVKVENFQRFALDPPLWKLCSGSDLKHPCFELEWKECKILDVIFHQCNYGSIQSIKEFHDYKKLGARFSSNLSKPKVMISICCLSRSQIVLGLLFKKTEAKASYSSRMAIYYQKHAFAEGIPTLNILDKVSFLDTYCKYKPWYENCFSCFNIWNVRKCFC